MGKVFSLLFLAVVAPFCLRAQLPADYRTEQVMLAPEHTFYSPGDSIFVDGLVTCLAADRVDPYSRIAVIELVSPDDSVMVRQKVLCADRGHFRTAIPTEIFYRKGIYYLRGYTRLMRNFSSDCFAIQPVLLGVDPIVDDKIIDYNVRCKVFVSSGPIDYGRPATVTAVLTNHLDYPVPGVELLLTDNSGRDTIASAVTSPSGYAHFGFIPQAGSDYCVALSANGVNKLFPVPEGNRCGFQTHLKGNRLYIELIGVENASERRFFVFDRDNGLAELNLNGENGGVVNLVNKPSGPVTVFMADNGLNVISQFTTVARRASGGAVSVADTVAAGDVLSLKFEGIDTVGCTVMTRVVPAHDRLSYTAEEILNYRADYESDIEFPACLAMTGNDFVANADLEAWLASSSFRRFMLSDVVETVPDSLYRYMPEMNIEVTGEVYNGRNNLKNGTLLAFNDYNSTVTDAPIDNHGRFAVALYDFSDPTPVFLQASDKNGKNIAARILIDDERYPAVSIPYRFRQRGRAYTTSGVEIGGGGDTTGFDKRLPDVTVKARYVPKKIENPKDFYSVRFKSREKIEERNYLTLRDIIRDMPVIELIEVTDEEPSERSMNKDLRNKSYVIRPKRYRSATIERDTIGVTLIVDGIRIDVTELGNYLDFPAMDIESVEYMKPGEALMYRSSLQGSLVVKTRSPESWKGDMKSKGTLCYPLGLSSAPASGRQKAPIDVGDYRLIVDVADGKGVRSFVAPFTVTVNK